ncbi:MAG: helix-turn-helix transcriptional regulator [Bacteriovoracia bacterium]
MKFNERLKQFRVLAKLSQREAAHRIGVPESTYREWEYGNAILGEPYPRVAKVFNVTLNELFGVSDSMERSATEEIDKIIMELQFLKSKLPK